jgi:ABC-type lipoprotein export system ATPase subunit
VGGGFINWCSFHIALQNIPVIYGKSGMGKTALMVKAIGYAR